MREVFLFAQDACKPPIHDINLVVASDHDIGGFEVAMDHALAVGVSDGIADLEEVFKACGEVEFGREGLFGFIVLDTFFDDLVEGFALDEFHGVGGNAIRGGIEGVEGDDVGMIELGGDLGFSQEAMLDHLAASGVLVQALDCDFAA